MIIYYIIINYKIYFVVKTNQGINVPKTLSDELDNNSIKEYITFDKYIKYNKESLIEYLKLYELKDELNLNKNDPSDI